MSDEYALSQSAREELLSLLDISRETHHDYDELAELAGKCLGEQFEAGRKYERRGPLKNCPFCGSPPQEPFPHYLDPAGVGREWVVSCSQCGGEVDLIFDTEDEAIAAWNRRT